MTPVPSLMRMCVRQHVPETPSGRQAAFVRMEVMLCDPCAIKAMGLCVNDLRLSKAIALARTGIVQKPGEEAKSFWVGCSLMIPVRLSVLRYEGGGETCGRHTASISSRV